MATIKNRSGSMTVEEIRNAVQRQADDIRSGGTGEPTREEMEKGSPRQKSRAHLYPSANNVPAPPPSRSNSRNQTQDYFNDYFDQIDQQRREAEERAKKQAEAEMQRLMQERERIAGQTKGNLQTNYERLQQLEQDQRNLQNNQFQRVNNPFSGGTDYRRAMLDRERSITDRQQSEDLQNRLASIDTSLQDYANYAPDIRSSIENELINRERNYATTAIDQMLRADQQGFNQMLSEFQTYAPYQYLTAYEQNQLPLEYSRTFGQYTGGIPAPSSTPSSAMPLDAQIENLINSIRMKEAQGLDRTDLVEELNRLLALENNAAPRVGLQ